MGGNSEDCILVDHLFAKVLVAFGCPFAPSMKLCTTASKFSAKQLRRCCSASLYSRRSTASNGLQNVLQRRPLRFGCLFKGRGIARAAAKRVYSSDCSTSSVVLAGGRALGRRTTYSHAHTRTATPLNEHLGWWCGVAVMVI